MQRIIELVERMYNLTYLSTEDEIHLFKCNGCGKVYRIQVISPAVTEQQERQPVPAAFYKAFENEAD
jgi:hypothetical protein